MFNCSRCAGPLDEANESQVVCPWCGAADCWDTPIPVDPDDLLVGEYHWEGNTEIAARCLTRGISTAVVMK